MKSVIKFTKEQADSVIIILAEILQDIEDEEMLDVLEQTDIGKYLNSLSENNLKHYGVLGMRWGKRKKYDRPYSLNEIKEKYGDKLFKQLTKDPTHKWRAETGIELIHKEPNLKELKRIWKNWNNMSKKQKELSDKKSLELFNKTNKQHYEELINSYEKTENFINNNKNILISEIKNRISKKGELDG